MNPFRSNPRRRRKTEFGPELLESRELLTGGNNLFAMVPGSIDTPNGTSAVKITLDPTQNFTLPRRAITMGIDIAPPSGSTLKPLIASVNAPSGDIVPQTFHSIYDPHATHLEVASTPGLSAVLSPLKLFPHGQTKPATYTVNIQALGKSSGSYILGFYLPGDANGDGAVNKTDLQIVKSLQGTRASQSNYNFYADANRDGRIGKIDLAFTKENLGVSTNVAPVVQANYDSSHDVGGLTTRTSSTNTAHFTGTATPGSIITYTETSNKVPVTTTTADSLGNYSLNVPLAIGTNTFNVVSKDPFGQTISGTLTPVSYLGTNPK